MELNEKLDRQVSLAVRDVVIRLSRNDIPDNGTLALALASGETAQTLAEKAKEKVDRRTAKPDEAAAAAPPAEPVAQDKPAQAVKAQTKK